METGIWTAAERYDTDDCGNLLCVSNSCSVFLEFSRCSAKKAKSRNEHEPSFWGAHHLWWSPVHRLKCGLLNNEVLLISKLCKQNPRVVLVSVVLLWFGVFFPFACQLSRNKKFAFLLLSTGITHSGRSGICVHWALQNSWNFQLGCDVLEGGLKTRRKWELRKEEGRIKPNVEISSSLQDCSQCGVLMLAWINKLFPAASALQDSYFSIFFYLYACHTSLWWPSAEGKKDNTENTMLLRLTEKLFHLRTTTFTVGEWRSKRGAWALTSWHQDRFLPWMVLFKPHYFLSFVVPMWYTLSRKK